MARAGRLERLRRTGRPWGQDGGERGSELAPLGQLEPARDARSPRWDPPQDRPAPAQGYLAQTAPCSGVPLPTGTPSVP